MWNWTSYHKGLRQHSFKGKRSLQCLVICISELVCMVYCLLQVRSKMFLQTLTHSWTGLWKDDWVTGVSWSSVHSSINSFRAVCARRRWGLAGALTRGLWPLIPGPQPLLHFLLSGCRELSNFPFPPAVSALKPANNGLNPRKSWAKHISSALRPRCGVFYSSNKKVTNTGSSLWRWTILI